MASKKISAGILLYRVTSGRLEIFLVHPGGPFWAKRDNGSWSIPKGELTDGAEPLETAKREFLEETGSPIDGALIEKEGWTEFGDWLGTGTKPKSKRTTE